MVLIKGGLKSLQTSKDEMVPALLPRNSEREAQPLVMEIHEPDEDRFREGIRGNCGKEVLVIPNKRKRLFCSEHCR